MTEQPMCLYYKVPWMQYECMKNLNLNVKIHNPCYICVCKLHSGTLEIGPGTPLCVDGCIWDGWMDG